MKKLLSLALSFALILCLFTPLGSLGVRAVDGSSAYSKINLIPLLEGKTLGELVGWDASGSVIKTKSTQEAGWGAAKGSLIDGVSGPYGGGAGPYAYLSSNAVSPSNSEYVIINLQKKYNVDMIELSAMYTSQGTGFPKDFTIQTSFDGEIWTTARTVTGFEPVNGQINYKFSFTEVLCKYVKIDVTAIHTPLSGTNLLILTEMSVYGQTPAAPKINLSGYISGDYVTWDSSNQYIITKSSQQAGWGAAKAALIDNVIGNFAGGTGPWGYLSSGIVSPTNNEYVILNLQSKYRVSRVAFSAMYYAQANGMPKDFTIQVSNDGTNWTTVVTKTDYLPQASTITYGFDFDEITCKYIKLDVTEVNGPTSGSNILVLTELEAFGTAVPTIERKLYGLDVVYSQIYDRISINDLASVIDQLGATSIRSWNNCYLAMYDYKTINPGNAKKLHDLYKAYQQIGITDIIGVTNYFFTPSSDNTGERTADLWVPARNTTPGSDYMKFLDMYRQTMKALAAEFPEVTHWEFGNEWNHNPFLHPKGWTEGGAIAPFTLQEKADITTDLMYYASLGVKQGNPNAVTIMPGMAPVNGLMNMTDNSITDYLQRIYTNIKSGSFGNGSKNIDDYFNIVAWHPYPPNNNNIDQTWVNSNNRVHNVMVANGDGDRPVYFTEVGLLDSGNAATDQAQATTLTNMYNYIENDMPYVTSVQYYRMFDDGNIDQFGFFEDPKDGIIPKAKGLKFQELAGGTGDLTPKPLPKETSKIDLSALVGGRIAEGMTHWDEEGSVITTSSSQEEGWGFAKASLIDGKIGDGFTGRIADNLGSSVYVYASAAQPTTNVDQWVTLNLQSGYKVNKVSFSTFAKANGSGMPKNFTIDVSRDGFSWTTVVTKTDFLPIADTVTYEFPFDEVAAKYVRLNVSDINDGLNGSNCVLLSEMAVFGSGSKIDFTSLLGLKRTQGFQTTRMIGWDPTGSVIQTSSSYEDMWMGGTGKGFLINNDTTPSVWGVGSNGFYLSSLTDFYNEADVNVWISLNMQQTYAINSFGFWTWYTAGLDGAPKDFTINVSKDGTNWTTVKTVTDYTPSSSGQNVFEFDTVEAQYIRLNVTEVGNYVAGVGNSPYAVALTEIEVYEDLSYVAAPEAIELTTESSYSISDGYICGVKAGISLNELKANFKNADYLVFDETVATGKTVKLIVNDVVVQTLTLVITGDVDGDGTVNLLDLLNIKGHILGTGTLTGAAYKASDIISDSTINILDIIKLRKFLLGADSL